MERHGIQMAVKGGGQSFGGDLFSFQVQAQVGQTESLKVEMVSVITSVEGFTLHQFSDKFGVNLTEEQIVFDNS